MVFAEGVISAFARQTSISDMRLAPSDALPRAQLLRMMAVLPAAMWPAAAPAAMTYQPYDRPCPHGHAPKP